PHKYELIHFTTARKRHNLQASVRLDSIEKKLTTSVRVLGVWLDAKLKWSAHAKIARQKGVAVIAALKRLRPLPVGRPLQEPGCYITQRFNQRLRTEQKRGSSQRAQNTAR